MRSLIVMLLLLTLLGGRSVAQSPIIYRTDWPVIQKLDFEIKIDAKSERIFFSIPIRNQSGKVLYTLACIGGSTDYLDDLCGKMNENFTGPMCFFLGKGEENITGKLLCEDGLPHWFSRGQIDYSRLVGKCGEYPEFGRLRHFRLRGMILEIQFKNIELDATGQPNFLDVHISAQRDKSVTSEITERPGFLMPEKDCPTIRRGAEPRQWRDSGGCWVEEKEIINTQK